jgi:hypothetical protein
VNQVDLTEHFWNERRKLAARRYFFRECGVGLGALALASLLQDNEALAAAGNPSAPRAPHFPARAKRVIYLFQAGGPSQLDLFNHCPGLAKYDGQPIPAEIVKNQRYAFNIMQDPVPAHDLHATILHLLGFDHSRLTYHFQGRCFRLTDVEGELAPKLLA